MLHKNLFYFDIETVGQYENLKSLSKNDKRGDDLFFKKYLGNKFMYEKSNNTDQAYLDYSPIYSAFGKIVCISFGYFNNNNQGYTINSIYNDNEEVIINTFNDLLKKVSKKHMTLSGWRILSFDIPWVLHKMNKYDLNPANIINVYGLKPWEINAIDLSDEWKQKFNQYISFDEACYELNIDSPKDKIDGSKVHSTYWEEHDLEGIKTYCEKDVYASMQMAEKMFKYK